ncbi:hypothetical protein ACVBEG_27255 [Pseudomonas sp. GG8]
MLLILLTTLMTRPLVRLKLQLTLADSSPGQEMYYNEERKKWYMRDTEERPGTDPLTAQEQVDKNLADKEKGFQTQVKELNRELSEGIGGKERFAGLVTSDQIQQWMRTAARNARGSSSPYWETMFEALSGLAEPVHQENVERLERKALRDAPPTAEQLAKKAEFEQLKKVPDRKLESGKLESRRLQRPLPYLNDQAFRLVRTLLLGPR